MDMRLMELHLRNFKGIKAFDFSPNGKNISVYGDNATGKTTLFDAFTWLLLGKDSTGRADFGIKPLDEHGEEIHGLDIEVTAIISIDGVQRVLRKIQRENWIKPKGRAQAVFTGNETTCELDGVPLKIGEYQAFIGELASPELFKQLTSAAAFNAMNTNDKRLALLSICGDASVPYEGEFNRMPELLGHATPQEARKRVKSRREELNRTLAQIPARIDEQSNAVLEIGATERSDIDYNIRDIGEDIANVDRQIAELRAGDPAELLKKQRKNIEERLAAARRERETAHSVRLKQLKDAVRDAETAIRVTADQVQTVGRAHETFVAQAQEYGEAIDGLRFKWQQVHGETFDASTVSDTCPICGQVLPEEQRMRALRTREAEFAEARLARETDINMQGKSARAQLEKIQLRISESEEELAALKQRKEQNVAEFADCRKALEEYETAPKEKSATEKALEEELSSLPSADDSDCAGRIAQMEERRRELMARLDVHKRRLYAIEQSDKAVKRIGELEAMQRSLGDQIAQAELDMALIERYIIATCKRLEDSVNALFSSVRWQLFDQYDNGNYRDACICTVGGVPYSSLNNAARINAGLEIINTLSRAHDVRLPIFIDNAESVNELCHTESQQIRLVVSHDDKITVKEEK